jgi:hypothetical protein
VEAQACESNLRATVLGAIAEAINRPPPPELDSRDSKLLGDWVEAAIGQRVPTSRMLVLLEHAVEYVRGGGMQCFEILELLEFLLKRLQQRLIVVMTGQQSLELPFSNPAPNRLLSKFRQVHLTTDGTEEAN